MARIRRKRITAKQRTARRKNIAIARKHRKKRQLRKVDKAVKKYVDYFDEKRPKKPPVKNVVFRSTKTSELKNIKRGKRSGKFWSSDPSEYGRHAMGRIGQKSKDKVLIAAKSSGRNRSYRGLHGGKNRHFQEIGSRSKRNIIGVYRWDGSKLRRKKR